MRRQSKPQNRKKPNAIAGPPNVRIRAPSFHPPNPMHRGYRKWLHTTTWSVTPPTTCRQPEISVATRARSRESKSPEHTLLSAKEKWPHDLSAPAQAMGAQENDRIRSRRDAG